MASTSAHHCRHAVPKIDDLVHYGTRSHDGCGGAWCWPSAHAIHHVPVVSRRNVDDKCSQLCMPSDSECLNGCFLMCEPPDAAQWSNLTLAHRQTPVRVRNTALQCGSDDTCINACVIAHVVAAVDLWAAQCSRYVGIHC